MPDGRNALRADTTPPQPRPVGRPTDYTPELADRICALIEQGNSLVEICRMKGMPDRSTVNRWLDKHQYFATAIARAREEQAEFMDDKILDSAKNCNEMNYQSTRVQIAAYQWRAAKLKPKKYGDRLDVQHTHTLDQLLAAVPSLPDPLAKPPIDSTATEITSNAVLADSKQSGE